MVSVGTKVGIKTGLFKKSGKEYINPAVVISEEQLIKGMKRVKQKFVDKENDNDVPVKRLSSSGTWYDYVPESNLVLWN